MEYKIEIDGKTYEMNELYCVTITRALFEQFSIGNACSAQIDLRFVPRGTVSKMARIAPFAREQEHETWCPLGVFYIDTRKFDSGIMEITGFDSMLKLDTVWIPDQSLTFPMSMPAVVREISRSIGVDIDERTVLNSDYTVDYPTDDYTLRDILRYIGAAHGGNWIITAENQLLLVPLFDSMPPETSYLVTETGESILIGGVRIIV